MYTVDSIHVRPGLPEPLGVTPRDGGLNVALWSGGAEAVDFCIRHADGTETRYRLPDRLDGIHYGFIEGHGAGTRYGFRVHGAWDPVHGARWNAHKLLLDPYAKAITGKLVRTDAIYAHRVNPLSPEDDSHADERDSGPYVPLSVAVGDRHFDWGTSQSPRIPWNDTVIYEAHVKGLTMMHPEVPEHLRGTYAGLAHDSIIAHLQSIGVTSLELLPVHQSLDEEHLAHIGLSNYWGYNTIGFFAPHAAYSSLGTDGGQIDDFRAMVKRYHEAGIEVLLDVVFNHSAEGGQRGPTVGFRGIDNGAYYRLADDRRYYRDYVGCGNTLDLNQPYVLRMVLDSLRYWVTEMRVDGFRFDLASALVRGYDEVNMRGTFAQAIAQDPVLRNVKLIAEPWDVGAGGYQVGHFPPLWAEWNDKFRDTTRDFWRGAAPGVADLGWRLTGSADLFGAARRKPWASINYVTCHDGFTLRDLVSYNEKHNLANGEMNRDGTVDNRSWNHGTEGATFDPEISELRARQQRNFLASVALSLGTPMINSGDEIGRTQHGNNNAYCQDNELAWQHWDLGVDQQDLLAFTQLAFGLRKEFAALRQPLFRWGQALAVDGPKDLAWFSSDGHEFNRERWNAHDTRTIGMFVTTDIGGAAHHPDPTRPALLVILHADADGTTFTLPGSPWATNWKMRLNTLYANGRGNDKPLSAGTKLKVAGRSLIVLEALRA